MPKRRFEIDQKKDARISKFLDEHFGVENLGHFNSSGLAKTPQQVGREAELRVADVLRDHQLVVGVKDAPEFNPGFDLLVEIETNRMGSLEIEVEVKANEALVTDYFKKLRRKHNLHSDFELKQWLASQKRMVLFAQSSDHDIRAAFTRRLNDIADYFAKTEEEN